MHALSSQFVGGAASAATGPLRTQSSNTKPRSLLLSAVVKSDVGPGLRHCACPRGSEPEWNATKPSRCWLYPGRHLRFPSSASRKAAISGPLVLLSAFVTARVVQAKRAITPRSRRGPTAGRATRRVYHPFRAAVCWPRLNSNVIARQYRNSISRAVETEKPSKRRSSVFSKSGVT